MLGVAAAPLLTITEAITIKSVMLGLLCVGVFASFVMVDRWLERAAAFGLMALTVPWFSLLAGEFLAHALFGTCLQ